MTREEAINILNRDDDSMRKGYFCINDFKAIEALKSEEPCEDVISRDELLKAIDTWDKFGCDATNKLVPYQDHYVPYIHYDDVVKCIKGMPSVKPQEPKTGHWIEEDMFDGDVAYRCSECDELFWIECGTPKDNDYNFCPNCGAKMIEPRESEES